MNTIILSGIKSAGKSLTESLIVKNDNYKFKKRISYTTRKPRKGEVDGVDYHFITLDEFERMELLGYFAESVEYNGNKYGLLQSDVLSDDKGVIVAETNGIKQIINNVGKDNVFIVRFICDTETQINRIINRDCPETYDEVIKLMEYLKKDYESFKRDDNYHLLIDTTNLKPHEVVSKVMSEYYKRI